MCPEADNIIEQQYQTANKKLQRRSRRGGGKRERDREKPAEGERVPGEKITKVNPVSTEGDLQIVES